MGGQSSAEKSLALHACCAPCLLGVYDALAGEAGVVTVVFANSNIHPREEHIRRRDALVGYASDNGIDFVELDYRPDEWLDAVGGARNREERCDACYEQRFRATAEWAVTNGFDTIATTLTVSPYQRAESIAVQGKRVALEAGLRYLDRDFRDRFSLATSRSRELGIYRQNYCGCIMSEIEARVEREARRATRRA